MKKRDKFTYKTEDLAGIKILPTIKVKSGKMKNQENETIEVHKTK